MWAAPVGDVGDSRAPKGSGSSTRNTSSPLARRPATLAARRRVLGTGRSNQNDPNDAMSVPVTTADTRSATRALGRATAKCCRCCRNGTSTSDVNDHVPCPSCTRCWSSSRSAGSPVKSTFPTHQRSSPTSQLRPLSSRSATTWPTISSATSALPTWWRRGTSWAIVVCSARWSRDSPWELRGSAARVSALAPRRGARWNCDEPGRVCSGDASNLRCGL